MRHQVAGKKLNRTTNQRQSLFKTQIKQLLQNSSLTTTEAKAKVIKINAEKILTKAQTNTIHNLRQIETSLSSKKAAQKAIEIAQKLTSPTGFITSTRIGTRKGDNTMMVRLELSLKKEEETKTVKADKDKEPKKTKTNSK